MVETVFVIIKDLYVKITLISLYPFLSAYSVFVRLPALASGPSVGPPDQTERKTLGI